MQFTESERSLIQDSLKEQKLYDKMVDRVRYQEEVTNWSRGVLDEYNNLPKNTESEIKTAGKLITDTAMRVIENPSKLTVAATVWKKNDESRFGEDVESEQETFYESVNNEAMGYIKKNWETITSEQLAGLTRVYAGFTPESEKIDGKTRYFTNEGPAKEFAKDLLKSYFQGPSDRLERPYPRILALYNFTSASLELVHEDDAFRESMKIAHYATDVLPRYPGLAEQVSILTLPSKKEEESDMFKKLLTIDSVTKQAIFLKDKDLLSYHKDNIVYVHSDPEILKMFDQRRNNIERQRGIDNARAIHADIKDSMNSLYDVLGDGPLTNEKKQELIKKRPFLAKVLDSSDPLNQKLQTVYEQLASDTQLH